MGLEWISFSSLKSQLNNSFEASLSAPSDVAEFSTNADHMRNCCEKERRDVAFGKGLFDKREPLALFELALVLVHFDHRIHSFRFASSNGMTCSAMPVAICTSKIS